MAADSSRSPDDRRKQARASGIVRIVWAASVFFIVGAALAIAACLPDLAPLPAPPATEPTSTNILACGDGLIETLDDGGDSGESCDPGDAQAAATIQTGCESCQFICPIPSKDDAGGHCYFQTSATSSYDEARIACEAVGAHIATFASEREVALVSSIVGDAGYWVGLTVNTAENYVPPTGSAGPGWPKAGAPTCPGCFAIGADAGEFAVDPEDIGAGPRLCLVSKNGVWLQTRCGDHSYAAVCEREPIGQRAHFCGSLFCSTLAATSGSKRYVLVLSPASAEQAREFCEASYKAEEGRLVVLSSREEREQLVREIRALIPPDPKKLPADDVISLWIGLTLKTNQWTWDDGQPEDAGRPLVWGSGAPGVATGRAYLRIDEEKFDTQLAYASEAGVDEATPRRFVCQRR